MKHVPILLSIVLGQLLTASTAAETIRLSGTVYRDGAADEALTDLLIVELSQQEHVEVLERRQLQMVLGELSLSALADDAWRQTRLGRLLGVDAFVWIRLRGDQAVLQVVEAAKRRSIATTWSGRSSPWPGRRSPPPKRAPLRSTRTPPRWQSPDRSSSSPAASCPRPPSRP